MAFCSFSSEVTQKNSVSIDNVFISDFLPILPEHCVKVYLYGLYNCSAQSEMENQMQSFVNKLNLSEIDIESCFNYLAELGLVYIVNASPIEVRYLPVSKTSAMSMKFNKDKFKHFNQKAQDLINGRVMTPTEFNEFYYTMESLHIEPDAMLMVVKYCVDLKGNNVSYKYILTVAKNWAYEGITTCEKVEERLLKQEAADSDLTLVLSALGTKKAPTVDDYQLFITWSQQMEFDLPVLVFLAGKAKKHKGGITRLDYLVNKFYKMRLTSKKEIEEYLQNEEALYQMAKEVCKNIGVRYDNLEIVVETYVTVWTQYGFDMETLTFLSKHCFSLGIRTLNGVNELVTQFYKMGLVTLESIENHLHSLQQLDENIKNILVQLGIVRSVNKFDREYYQTWIYKWEINEELLNFAISQSSDKVQPMQFLNKLLSVYHTKNIATAEQAKQEKLDFLNNSYVKQTPGKTSKKAAETTYSKEQLNTLFTSIEEVEI